MEKQAEYITETQEALEMLGKGYEAVRAKDESGDKKYFTITPRIVKSLSRNAHDFAVWDTIKDIAGENGECFLNTDQIAILSGCSAGQVSSSRKYWLKIGFLKGEIKKDPGYSQAVWHLTVPDLWQKNVEWCEKYPKIADRLAFRETHRSLHRMKPSPSEGKPSPSETKKNLIKKNNLNEDEEPNAAKVYEQEIGVITPAIADSITDWEKLVSKKWLVDAIHISAKNNARSWSYVEAILKRWKAQGNQNETKQEKGKYGNSQRNPIPEPAYTETDYEVAELIRQQRLQQAV